MRTYFLAFGLLTAGLVSVAHAQSHGEGRANSGFSYVARGAQPLEAPLPGGAPAAKAAVSMQPSVTATTVPAMPAMPRQSPPTGPACGADPSCCKPACDDCNLCSGGCESGGWYAYADYLLLRPDNDRISYAVPINGAVTPPVTAGPIQIGTELAVDTDFNSGFRLGFGYDLGCGGALEASYAYLDSSIQNGPITFTQPVLRSLVQHPGTYTATGDFLSAVANSDVRFELIDLDYRRQFWSCNGSHLDYLVGLRYGNLHQSFGSTFSNTTTIERVNVNNDFDGIGVRAGLEGQKRSCRTGLLVYGKGAVSLLGGVARERYLQSDNFRGTVVSTGFDEDRVISIMDLEVGAGWQSDSGKVKVTAGYTVSAWLNTINTSDFIYAVQTNTSKRSSDLNDNLNFDGVTVRAEFKF